jgi:hypothetical protein
MSYRLVPLAGQNMVNDGWAFEKLNKDFAFGGSEKQGVYFDEENRRHLIGIRQSYAEVSNSLASGNRKEEARKLLQRLDSNMRADNVPYGLVSRQNQHNMISAQLAEAAYKADDTKLGDKIAGAVNKDLREQLAYYAYLGNMSVQELMMAIQDIMTGKADNLSNRQRGMFIDIRQSFALQEYLNNMEMMYKKAALPSNESSETIMNAPDSMK